MKPSQRRQETENDELRHIAVVHDSACSDLLGSLRVLYSPRSYPTMRGWVAETKKALPPDLLETGRFYFQGHDTSVGYGAVRLIPDLGDDAAPEDLIRSIEGADPVAFALFMLDSTGEVDVDRIEASRRVLEGSEAISDKTRALEDLSTARKSRYQRILDDPAEVKAELAELLWEYHRLVYSKQADEVANAVRVEAKRAQETLNVLPTTDAVEQLTGGYTLSADFPIKRLTIVPSVFLYPFVAVRIDEKRYEAIILYGARSAINTKFDTVPVNQALLQALKAMSDPARLQILALLSEQEVTGPDLVDRVALSQPTVHHHIATLRAANLVRQVRTRDGMLLSLREDVVDAFLTGIADTLGRSVDGVILGKEHDDG